MFFRWHNGILGIAGNKSLRIGGGFPHDEISIYESMKTDLEIRRPLLARGTKAACLGTDALFNNQRSCFSAIRLCSYVFSGPECRVDYPRQIPNSRSVTSPKIVLFSSVFSRPEISENGPQGLNKKTTQVVSEIYKKRFP